jgi:hypothetical protein
MTGRDRESKNHSFGLEYACSSVMLHTISRVEQKKLEKAGKG